MFNSRVFCFPLGLPCGHFACFVALEVQEAELKALRPGTVIVPQHVVVPDAELLKSSSRDLGDHSPMVQVLVRVH
uniref:(California timema) hypothetical protein n=1 Tax=Timema californicum TaxID=61474 RepID=A0A7R9J8C0_TIMCA|nr:unnamed protein product [Timema californicum]